MENKKVIEEGQIVKFHTPMADEDPNQLYVVLEVVSDDENPRAEIKALNTELSFPTINKVQLADLEVVEVNDLIDHFVVINKSDFSQVEGKVIKVSEQKINLDLSKGISGVETNVWVTVVDNQGLEHLGTLSVN